MGRKTEKVISHWFDSLQWDNCFMNPPSIFTLLFSFGSFVCRVQIGTLNRKYRLGIFYLDNVTLSNVDDSSQAFSTVQGINGSIHLKKEE